MKNISIISIILAMLLFAGCETTSSSSNGPETAASSVGDGNLTLVIEYDESDPRMRSGGYNTINNELDRFMYLQKNFEDVFEAELSEYELDFQLFPAEKPANGSKLELTLLSFYSPSPIELEIRMWVTLKTGDKKKDLGVVSTRIVPQQPMTSGSIERDLDEIYSNVANKVLQKISGQL